jgi:hypothetical protein
MKKVLILAYDFPPYVSVGGLRPYSWYKYFHEFGLYPVVVTRQWGNKYGNHLDYVAAGESDECIVEESEHGTIIRTPYKPNLSNRLLLKYGESRFRIVRKLITAFFEIAQWVFIIGPKAGLYKGADEYLSKNKVDCIIATGDPFVLFLYASRFSKKYSIPWIADYRDTWIQDKTGNKFFLLTRLFIYIEKKILASPRIITTVSEFIVSHISSNVIDGNYQVIMNGFDSDLCNGLEEINQYDDYLSFAFSGTIYKWHPWESVLLLLNDFAIQVNMKIRIDFFGTNIENQLSELASKCNNLIVNIHPKKSNSELLKNLSKANVLLLFNDYSILGTKIFDYLAVKRKIFFCFANDYDSKILKQKYFCIPEFEVHNQNLQADMIVNTNSGIVIENKAQSLSKLTEIYNEFLNNKSVLCKSSGFEDFSRKNQTKKLSDIIKTIINES